MPFVLSLSKHRAWRNRSFDGLRANESLLLAFNQIDKRRQKARQRLARAGGSDEQDGAARLRDLQQLELMRPRSPAARAEPAPEGSGQQVGVGCG